MINTLKKILQPARCACCLVPSKNNEYYNTLFGILCHKCFTFNRPEVVSLERLRMFCSPVTEPSLSDIEISPPPLSGNRLVINESKKAGGTHD